MITTELVAKIWFWMIVAFFLSWLVTELALIWMARRAHQTDWAVWTLSDQIRRWAKAHRWIAPGVMLLAAFLAWHFFVV